MRAVHGDKHRWQLTEQLLDRLVFLAEVDLWRNSDPKKRGPAPQHGLNPWAAEHVAAKKAEQRRKLEAFAAREAERQRRLAETEVVASG